MSRILVTGGAGFIGSNFIRMVLEEHPDSFVVNLDKLTYAGNLESLAGFLDHDSHHFIRGDICDGKLVEKVIDHYQIDTIVNFAAESHVDRSIAGAKVFIETNVAGTLSLLEAARDKDRPETRIWDGLCRSLPMRCTARWGLRASSPSRPP